MYEQANINIIVIVVFIQFSLLKTAPDFIVPADAMRLVGMVQPAKVVRRMF